MKKYLILNNKDNVAVATENLENNTKIRIDGREEIILKNPIPFAHKFSLKDLDTGDSILKYGEIIGTATMPIKTGEHVHIHNIKGIYMG